MFGLMTKKAHEAILAEKEEDAYQAWRRVADERDKYRSQVRDTCARAEKAEASLKLADNQTSAAIRERDALRRQLDETKAAAARDITAEQRRNERLAAEIASLRPDAEKFRAKAKADAERKKAQRAAAKKGAA